MNSSKRLSGSRSQTHALLSIKPRYTEAIFDGSKRFEFRRASFARSVAVALIYATTPIKRVVGEFDVGAVITAPLDQLWQRTRKYAGIDRDFFFEYFDGLTVGHAIEIGDVRPYSRPFCPMLTMGVRPPQSFQYVDPPKRRAVIRTRMQL